MKEEMVRVQRYIQQFMSNVATRKYPEAIQICIGEFLPYEQRPSLSMFERHKKVKADVVPQMNKLKIS